MTQLPQPPLTPPSLKIIGWQLKDYADGWIFTDNEKEARKYQRLSGCLMRPVYTFEPETPAELDSLKLIREAAIREAAALSTLGKTAMQIERAILNLLKAYP